VAEIKEVDNLYQVKIKDKKTNTYPSVWGLNASDDFTKKFKGITNLHKENTTENMYCTYGFAF